MSSANQIGLQNDFNTLCGFVLSIDSVVQQFGPYLGDTPKAALNAELAKAKSFIQSRSGNNQSSQGVVMENSTSASSQFFSSTQFPAAAATSEEPIQFQQQPQPLPTVAVSSSSAVGAISFEENAEPNPPKSPKLYLALRPNSCSNASEEEEAPATKKRKPGRPSKATKNESAERPTPAATTITSSSNRECRAVIARSELIEFPDRPFHYWVVWEDEAYITEEEVKNINTNVWFTRNLSTLSPRLPILRYYAFDKPLAQIVAWWRSLDSSTRDGLVEITQLCRKARDPVQFQSRLNQMTFPPAPEIRSSFPECPIGQRRLEAVIARAELTEFPQRRPLHVWCVRGPNLYTSECSLGDFWDLDDLPPHFQTNVNLLVKHLPVIRHSILDNSNAEVHQWWQNLTNDQQAELRKATTLCKKADAEAKLKQLNLDFPELPAIPSDFSVFPSDICVAILARSRAVDDLSEPEPTFWVVWGNGTEITETSASTLDSRCNGWKLHLPSILHFVNESKIPTIEYQSLAITAEDRKQIVTQWWQTFSPGQKAAAHQLTMWCARFYWWGRKDASKLTIQFEPPPLPTIGPSAGPGEQQQSHSLFSQPTQSSSALSLTPPAPAHPLPQQQQPSPKAENDVATGVVSAQVSGVKAEDRTASLTTESQMPTQKKRRRLLPCTDEFINEQ